MRPPNLSGNFNMKREELIEAKSKAHQLYLDALDNYTRLAKAILEQDCANDELSHDELKSKYQSDCQPGYDTIVGYLSKVYPEVLDLLEDPMRDTVALGKAVASEEDARAMPVYAPDCFKKRGCHIINSYPIRVIDRVYREQS